MSTKPLSSMARILRLSSSSFEEIVDATVSVLLNGGIVALPTDTLYGVSTLIEHSDKLYALKRRPTEKPLGLFLAGPEDVPRIAHQTISSSLAGQLLPGPVTLIFERQPTLSSVFNPGTGNVGVRVPDSPLVRAICKKIGQPLAQTSANVSGSPFNPTRVEDFEDLLAEIDLVVDAGQIQPPMAGDGSGEGSTIVDLTEEGVYRIVRDGCAKKKTEEVLRAHRLQPIV